MSNHAMAGDQHGNIVRSIGAADCTAGLGVADHRGKFAIASRFASGDFPQGGPDALLEGCAFDVERDIGGSGVDRLFAGRMCFVNYSKW